MKENNCIDTSSKKMARLPGHAKEKVILRDLVWFGFIAYQPL